MVACLRDSFGNVSLEPEIYCHNEEAGLDYTGILLFQSSASSRPPPRPHPPSSATLSHPLSFVRVHFPIFRNDFVTCEFALFLPSFETRDRPRYADYSDNAVHPEPELFRRLMNNRRKEASNEPGLPNFGASAETRSGGKKREKTRDEKLREHRYGEFPFINGTCQLNNRAFL